MSWVELNAYTRSSALIWSLVKLSKQGAAKPQMVELENLEKTWMAMMSAV